MATGNINTTQTVLLVDDEQDFVQGLSRLLGTEFGEIELLQANNGDEALEKLEQYTVDLMITDFRMPVMDGMELMAIAQRRKPELKIILLTGFGTIEKAVEAVRCGAFDFLTKPVASEQLFRVVGKALDFIRLEQENRELKSRLVEDGNEDLLGDSPAMRQLKQSIEAVASADYPVLVMGESGTGKELVSRRIHQCSRRKDQPFIAVNCPAIPDTLLESELFGHRKGAFTGADKDKDGLFLAADGGTLHLDEIGDISQAMQTKLLRFLQEGEVRPLGSNVNLSTSVRVIASTNQDLEKKVDEGLFRADLYYRLNVIAVNIPPLRDRVEDIPLLVHFFIRTTCREMKVPVKEILPDALTYLLSRQWPGNVRELQNYIRRLAVFSGNDEISRKTIQLVETQGDEQLHRDSMSLGSYKEMKAYVADRFSKQYLEQLLNTTRGNVSEASRISGLSRVAINKLAKRLGVAVERFRE